MLPTANGRSATVAVVTLFLCLALGVPAHAFTVTVRVDGPDAIFLAGRTDLTIPPASSSWPGGLLRHPNPTPEEALERLPPTIAVHAGDVIRVLDPAIGGINFYNGFGPPFFGPEGGGSGRTDLSAFGGISGFLADSQGPLVGVFLDNNVPNGTAPARLDFTNGGLGTNFTTLSPGLGQVFFIGDGVTSNGTLQQFIAPAGATRLAFGIPDGFGFVGKPGAYDDNDGFYQIRVGINSIPSPVPEPRAALLLVLAALALLLRPRAARGA
ncbi:MAG: PEP-CTERM sorting domain-containing protein [Planctomycetota bacterium]|nr:MAG: PEP-CTERM sorting domain-containing protein [Planctomycetota bacterium]